MVFVAGFAARTRAELNDVVEGTVIYSAVTCATNEASAKELQDAIGIQVWKFKVHRSGLTNGLAVYVEIRTEGRPVRTAAQMQLDRVILENQNAGEEIPVLVALNPVGSLDGESITTAKKLRFVIREAGVQTAGVLAENPFYKNKNGLATWGIAAKESPTVFKLMDCSVGATESEPKTELTVRFHEF